MASGNKKRNWMVRIGNLVEESIAKGIYELGQEAPILLGEPAEKVWYKVPVPEGKCADGSEYHIYVRKGTCDKLCVFFSGGGIAINEYMAARPVNGGSVAAWLPNYYWNNLRVFTQVMNINVGITKNGPDNPFDDWNFLVITYATGDMHVGNSTFRYHVVQDDVETEEEDVLYFHGYENFLAAMRVGKKLFPVTSKLLIAGESAGAFAVPALAEQIAGEFYPACRDVTLFSDSAQLLFKDWKRTLRDVWQTREELWKDLSLFGLRDGLSSECLLQRRDQQDLRHGHPDPGRLLPADAENDRITQKTEPGIRLLHSRLAQTPLHVQRRNHPHSGPPAGIHHPHAGRRDNGLLAQRVRRGQNLRRGHGADAAGVRTFDLGMELMLRGESLH